MKTPIVLLFFNRPDTTQKVFEVIRQVKPPKLFLVADGARPERTGEAEKCQLTRKIVEQIDWDCQVFKNYSEVNLGCRDRVSSGLDWVFSQVEEAIILEDDCLPNLSFFRFCEDLLDYYRNDQRVMMISGNNFQFGHQRTNYSYYFSRYTHIWGWATWGRAWKYYDVQMKLWPEVKDSSWLKTILDDQKSINYWNTIFQNTYESAPSVWDYRWVFACWLQSGLTILPQVNLVSNIGFGEEATHTVSQISPLGNLPTESLIFPLKHPPMVIRNFEADVYCQNTLLDPPLSARIKSKIQRVLKFPVSQN
jgi:hypothetical protein